MWSVGDRVLGKRPEEPFWYPGTVKHSDGTRYFVLFDDGEDALLPAAELARLEWQAGDRVFVRAATSRAYTAATVSGKDGDALQVRFDDGRQEWTSAARLRVDPAARRPALAEEEAAPQWTPGDAVLACGPDSFWYPGAVLALRGRQVHVVLDDGNQLLAEPGQLRKLTVEIGDAVQGRWQGGPEFFPGEVTRRDGQVVQIRYEDGDEEVTLLRLLRLDRDDWLPGEMNWSEGDRVLGQWLDTCWYPGVVLAVNGKRLQVLFDDGDQALLSAAKLKRLSVQVGDRVACRRGGGQIFYPGEVAEKRGETIRVHYDDGQEETTTVRLLRVEPEGMREGME